MKIIQICAAYKPAYVYGGPTMSVSKLSEELVKAGADVIVLTTTANGKTELQVTPGEEQIVDGVKVFYFKRWTKDHTHFSPALLLNLRKCIKIEDSIGKKSQLIIHIHAWWNLVSIFSCLVARFYGVKVILSPRGMLTQYSLNNKNTRIKNLLHTLLGKPLLKKVHIHATSSKEQTDVLEAAAPKSITIIPNFVRFPQALSTVPKTEDGYFKLIFLSRIEEKKGLELMFQALAKINFAYRLQIAGSGKVGYIQSLKKLANQLNISTHITWLGAVNDQSKFPILQQSDLLVLTSQNENFANVVVESLAMGTPVLISNKVGLADTVVNNKWGWVCENTPETIADKLHQAYNDNKTRISINKNAPEQISAAFNTQNLAQQYLSMYQQIVN